MRKILLMLLAVFIAERSFCQQTSYSLPLPEKWGVEKIAFPISFAPEIPYRGNEEIRFTPGWSNAESDEYWSYTYLWFIEGTPKINSDTLQAHLVQYFNGLFRSNNKTKPANKDVSFTKPQIKRVKTAFNDHETYEGKILTLNFLTGKPIEFFTRIHVRNYTNHSALLFELSPKPYKNKVWQELDGIVNGFKYR